MRWLFAGALLIFSFGCSKREEQFEKIVFDALQLNERITFKYTTYPSGKIKTKRTVTWPYRNGALLDSMVVEERYIYNDKGQIIKIEEEDRSELRFYNDSDSLVAQYIINSFGDTTLLKVNEYESNKLTQTIYRQLHVAFDLNDISKTDFRKYDTSYRKEDYRYFGDTLAISTSSDKTGKISSEAHIRFVNRRMVKTVIYGFLGSQKFLKNVTTYHQRDSFPQGYVSLNTSGDTVGIKNTFYQGETRIDYSYWTEPGHDIEIENYLVYNAKGQLLKDVMLDKNLKVERLYFYDEKGWLVEETRSTERNATDQP